MKMENDNHATFESDRATSITVRDLLAIGFRQRQVVVRSFLVMFLGVFLFVLLRPAQYEAQMKFLVKRERVDPVVSSESSSQRQPVQVTEEELNSEVEILKSRDLLAKVVVATGLHERQSRLGALRDDLLGSGDDSAPDAADRKVALAVDTIAEELNIQALRKSSLIRVSYASPNPALSVSILRTLADRYLEKHLAVHRPSGAFKFFEQETERYRNQMTLVQARLDQQSRDEGVVSLQAEKDSALKRLVDFEALEQTTRVQIAETEERLRVLEAQAASTPARATTEIRTVSAGMIEQLQSTLMPLELKRTELLRVFQPSYGPVVEIEAHIAKLRAAIDSAKERPLVEEATNRDPTYDYLRTEMARNRSELAAIRARAAATAQFLSIHRHKARRLEQVGIAQQALLRDARQAEENYLVYARKREEARISNALDAERILNVAIAEEATVPYQRSGPRRALLLLFGTVFAGLLSVGFALVKDYLDPSFRTPSEVQAHLGIPVLASIPRSAV
jgi:uncharacterized protein involved in exopolysaccharide biosynthesis